MRYLYKMGKHIIDSFSVFADYLNFIKGRKKDFNLDIEIGTTTFYVDVSDKNNIIFSIVFIPNDKAKKNGCKLKKFEYTINTKKVSELMKNRIKEFCNKLPTKTTYDINQKSFRFFKKVVKKLSTKMYFFLLLKTIKNNYYNIRYKLITVIGLHSGIPVQSNKKSTFKSTEPTQEQIQNFEAKVQNLENNIEKNAATIAEYIYDVLGTAAKNLNAAIKNDLSFFETESPLRDAVKDFLYAIGAELFLDYLTPEQKEAIQADAAAKEQVVKEEVGGTIDTAVENLETTASDVYAQTPELLNPEEFDLVAEEIDIRVKETII